MHYELSIMNYARGLRNNRNGRWMMFVFLVKNLVTSEIINTFAGVYIIIFKSKL